MRSFWYIVYICHQWGISGTLCISNFSEEFLVHCVYLSWDQNTKIEKPNDFKVFESMTLKGINKIQCSNKHNSYRYRVISTFIYVSYTKQKQQESNNLTIKDHSNRPLLQLVKDFNFTASDFIQTFLIVDIIFKKINLFSPWYSWKISELALNNNQSLTPIRIRYILHTLESYTIIQWEQRIYCIHWRVTQSSNQNTVYTAYGT